MSLDERLEETIIKISENNETTAYRIALCSKYNELLMLKLSDMFSDVIDNKLYNKNDTVKYSICYIVDFDDTNGKCIGYSTTEMHRQVFLMQNPKADLLLQIIPPKYYNVVMNHLNVDELGNKLIRACEIFSRIGWSDYGSYHYCYWEDYLPDLKTSYFTHNVLISNTNALDIVKKYKKWYQKKAEEI